MALTLGISLVSMNRPRTLKMTLERLDLLGAVDVPPVIVDNGSTDEGTLALLDLRERAGWDIHRLGTNMGLSRAVNTGLRSLNARLPDLLVHMDDDALIQGPNPWPERVKRVFECSPELGLLVPNHGSEFIPNPNYDEIRWGLGFCWAMRKEVYSLIGGYDPQLLHQQECDFAVRVRMAGYTVGALADWHVVHNDPGEPRSDLSLAREHLGCVQFRDKWCSYFRGLTWNYGTMPLYLMQHWPPDEEWYRRYSLAHGIDLNPPPKGFEHEPGLTAHEWYEKANAAPRIERRLKIQGGDYVALFSLRPDFMYWAALNEEYKNDRTRAIDRWFELTGERYGGYVWPTNLLKPLDG